MDIYCITLNGSTERQKKTEALLTEIGIDFSFFVGVDARIDKNPLLDRYDEKQFSRYMGRTAAIGEMGCYASHYLLWKKCVELGKPIIILEDDLYIEPHLFIKTIEHTRRHIEQCGYIRIESARSNRLLYKISDFGQQSLVKYLKVPQCTTGYGITPSTAQRFIDASERFCFPVDVFLRNTFKHQQAMFGITNPGLHGGSAPSIIGARKKRGIKQRSLAIIRACYKVKTMCLNFITNIVHVLNSEPSLRPSFLKKPTH